MRSTDTRASMAIALVLTLAGCSQAPTTSGPSDVAAATPSPARSDHAGRGSPSGGDKHNAKEERDEGSDHVASEDASPAGSADEPAASGDGGSGSGSQAAPAQAPYPSAGTYTYAQQGWEEFCQTTCDRQDLPDRQTMDIDLRGANRERAVVEATAQQSSNRTTRTTFLFTRDSALITNVYAKVTYSGFTIEENYEPDPPVTSLSFPLSIDKNWSGSWKADTSGDYSVVVTGRESVTVDGRAVDAFIVTTSTTFRGEYEGSADITAWVDPATRSIVKSTGKVHLKSNFGTYGTRFEIALLGGPGY